MCLSEKEIVRNTLRKLISVQPVLHIKNTLLADRLSFETQMSINSVKQDIGT